ncbi:14779_t:CDS:1, partial [Gigaspora rosea]
MSRILDPYIKVCETGVYGLKYRINFVYGYATWINEEIFQNLYNNIFK